MAISSDAYSTKSRSALEGTVNSYKDILQGASFTMVKIHVNYRLRPRQDGRHFPDDIFKYIFLNENVWISIKISLKFVLKGLINNIPTLVQIMAWHRPGYKPLSESIMVSLPTHICVSRPQWVKKHFLARLMFCCTASQSEARFKIKVLTNTDFNTDFAPKSRPMMSQSWESTGLMLVMLYDP